jgi:FKBP-type peptidyl-prolyl cis-trans isomerase
MKKILSFLFVGASVVVVNAQNTDNQIKFTTDVDSVSYIFGNMIANDILRVLPEVKKELILKGVSDVLYANKALLNDPDNRIINTYMQKKQQAQFMENKISGEKFLEKNKKEPKVKVTASGLQYLVINMGKGEKPTSTTRVKVHYHGTTIEGKVFDSSVNRGEPATFGLNQVIPGWTEGLQLMPVGSKFRFFIPQELAYGENPLSQEIKPYSVLIFDVELLSIEQ